MNNDLISRSALKKACSEMVKGSNNSDFIPCPTWNKAMELIDNAPTVEAYPFEQVQELVKLNQQFAQEIENLKRPTGKWIYHKEWENEGSCGYECSCCGRAYDYAMNFCGYCGADMKGGAE